MKAWFRPLDIVVLLVILLLSLLFLLGRGGRGRSVCVTVNGELRERIDLSALTEETTYHIETPSGTLVLKADGEGVCVLSSDCPDGVCVRTGRIEREGESILCAPLGVAVFFEEGGDMDAVTG